MKDEERRNRPRQTAGPSIPVEGPQPGKPFHPGAFPGRDAPDAGRKPDANPHAQVFRSPYQKPDAEPPADPRASFTPVLSVPTGGGALRSIGEKFSANPFTGTGSTSVPVATSPGRGGFGPSLSLGYGSGQGNGPFGLGWSLGVPAITRKTDKGLPQYRDGHPDSEVCDTFVLAGAEDLVPVLDGGVIWSEVRSGCVVHRFQPRVEGGFSQIERFTSQTTGEVYWRTISSSNVTHFFGKTSAARIADPKDSKRVFSWHLEESHDDRGNIVVYGYKQENLEGVDVNTPQERPRLQETDVQAERYLKRIKYGNSTPFTNNGEWLFEVVLDYGEHGTWHDDQLEVTPDEDQDWPVREDTYSTHRAGFEVRTRRLCRRILMFHRIEALSEDPYLVASTDLVHDEDPAMTRLVGVIQRSYELDIGSGYYDVASLPTLEFEYSDASLDPVLHTITDPTTLRNLPSGIDGRMVRLVDLDGEGVPGIVTESSGNWYYKRGLGDGRFGPMMALPSRPSSLGTPGVQLMDLDGDGRKELVSFVAPSPGFFTRTANEGWGNFRRFASVPNIDWQDPRLQLIDLSGDGFPDILIDRGDTFAWYRSKGSEGFEAPRRIPNTHPTLAKPVLFHADARTSIQFADMTGDGLPDLVRIRNGEVAYWPSLGFGRFGAMIRMGGLSPFATASNLFDPGRIRLSDVDGSGTTDLIYLDDHGATIYRNLAGNGFAAGQQLTQFPGVRSVDWAEVVDLKGNGTSCLVFSTSLSAGRGGVLRYIDLTGGVKPHLLVATKNNMGAETRVAYAPSTKFYLRDKQAGRPWLTKLPFPVHVVERVEHLDEITRQRYVQTYDYHHGAFDGQEREFRGFGMVETWDTESFEDFAEGGLFTFEHFDAIEEDLHQPPVHAKSWFHTGVFVGYQRLSKLFAEEYWQGDEDAWSLPDCTVTAGLSGSETREAVRALAGKTLRTEVYALDGTADEGKPYTVTEATFEVRRLQEKGKNRWGVYLPLDRETITHHYERNAADPRIAHTVALEIDDYGTPIRNAAVVYPRRGSPTYTEQTKLHITLDEKGVVHLDQADDTRRLAVPTETRTYELHNLEVPSNAPFLFAELLTAADEATEIAYTETPAGTGEDPEKRLLVRMRMRYWEDDLGGPLAHGSVESKALPYDSDALAMTNDQRTDVFGSLTGAPSNGDLTGAGGYVLDDDKWWVRSGHPTYDDELFFQIIMVTDPFGEDYTTTWDDDALLPLTSTDPLGNVTEADHDYRVLSPWQVTDPNGNRTQVAFDRFGFVSKLAVMGKLAGSDGDTLEDPTITFEYDLDEYATTGEPNWTKTRTRETHQDEETRWLEQRSYFSGAGAVVMVKVQARPGLAPERDENGDLVFVEGELQYSDTSPDPRWVGNGRVIKDNKGNVVKQYEPYYSSLPDYEDETELVEQGVTPLMHYDPLGRLIRTDFPNGTFSFVEFTPWEQVTHDQNDTVADSDWYEERYDYGGSDPGLLKEKRAALEAYEHRETPTTAVLDTLGRTFLTIAHNKDGVSDLFYETKQVLDIQGRVLQVIDARGNTAELRTYGMLGQPFVVSSHDAGDRVTLLDALGQPMRTWDDRNQRFSVTYDTLRRPVDRSVSVSGGGEKLLTRIVYGELLSTPAATNHKGRVYRVYDGGGVATTNAFDFKGNPVEEERQLYDDETVQPDWSDLLGEDTIAEMETTASSLLSGETFTASSTRDALGRVVTATSPDDSVVTYLYDEGGALQEVTVEHRGDASETVVGDVTYDAKGRRETVVYGSTGSPTSTTTYTYDSLSQRLTRLRTERESDEAAIQSLHYHYDPVGNIADIRDTAQQTVYFQNSVVTADCSYTYDAVYRLVEATGREHSTEGTAQRTHVQPAAGPQPMTSDPSAMRTYTQSYLYDEVGNILEMVHTPGTGSGWTRYYEYDEVGNQLLATSIPADDPEGPYSDEYTYDDHGNMITMPHLSSMVWNHDDELLEVTAGSETVYCQYAGGQRVRKYVEKSGSTTEERIYLGPWEIFRKRVSGDVDVEIESLHVSDDTGRILLIETKTVDEGDPVGSPTGVWRFQLSNHIGSASTEITDEGEVISYEEYHPYGTTAYRAVDATVEVSAKRYRYTGMERDEETGLALHGARYYAGWLGRWTAADPIGIGDGVNRYAYVGGAPVVVRDVNGTFASPPTEQEIRQMTPEEFGAFQRSPESQSDLQKDATPKSKPKEAASDGGGGGAAVDDGQRQKDGPTPIEEAAALAAALTGEDVNLHAAETKLGLAWGLAPEGTETSAGVILAAIVSRELAVGLALGVAGKLLGGAGKLFRKLGLEGLAKRADEFGENLRKTGGSGDDAATTTDPAADGFGGPPLEGGQTAVRTFTSPDPLVGEVATQIEALSPGRVAGVNRVVRDPSTGAALTDLDIELTDLIVQVKSGKRLEGAVNQIQRGTSTTGKPGILFAPNLRRGAVREAERQGIEVVRSLDDLKHRLGL